MEISRSSVKAIVATVLGSKDSFEFSTPCNIDCNNTIFFVTARTIPLQQYVLKIGSGASIQERIENEVRSISCVSRFCLEVPTPKVVAWSPNGRTILDGNIEVRGGQRSSGTVDTADSIPGWILMTWLPGHPLDPSRLTAEENITVVYQLAEMVKTWRSKIPKRPWIGNLSSQVDVAGLPGKEEKLIARMRTPPAPEGSRLASTDSSLAYWAITMRKLMHDLEHRPAFAPNRSELLPLLDDFVDNTLPHLPLFQSTQENKFVFTHTDLAPRNILVSTDSPPRITGIIDFEFSGFFPSHEEFMPEYTDLIDREAGNWPKDMYVEFLKILESDGVETPLSMAGSDLWRQLHALQTLEECIAPWRLVYIGSLTDQRLADAAEQVKEAIDELKLLIKRSICPNTG